MIVSWPYRKLCRNKKFFWFFFQKLVSLKFCTNTYIFTTFRTLCRCIDLVSMRIASLTLWQTRFSRKSHHVRFFYFFKTLFILYHFISSHFFRKCKPAFQKLFYLTIVKNRESLIIKLWLLFWINKQILQWGKSIKFLSY